MSAFDCSSMLLGLKTSYQAKCCLCWHCNTVHIYICTCKWSGSSPLRSGGTRFEFRPCLSLSSFPLPEDSIVVP